MPTADEFGAVVTGPADAPCLTLHDQPLGDAWAARLAASEWPSRLHALAPWRCGIGPAGARALAAASWPHLHTLGLGGNPLGDSGAVALATSPGFPALRHLNLSDGDIHSDGARALADSTTLSGLTELILGLNGLGGDGVRAFGSAGLPRLTSLELSADALSVPDAAALLAGPGLPCLSRLVVNGRLLDGDRLRRARGRGTLPVPGGNAAERAILDAVRDDPDDDTVRLAYADWIEEQGDPDRARFIRLQIEAERLLPGEPRRADLERQAAESFRPRGRDWVEPALLLLSWFWDDALVYRRGFPEELVFGLGVQHEQLPWALALYPIRTMRYELTDWPGDIPALLREPRLTQLRTLTLVGTEIQPYADHGDFGDLGPPPPTWRGVTEDDAALLAGCPALRGLDRLVLERHDGVTPGALGTLRAAFGARLEVR